MRKSEFNCLFTKFSFFFHRFVAKIIIIPPSSRSRSSTNYFVMQFKCFEIELFKLIALFCREASKRERSFKNVDEYFFFISGVRIVSKIWTTLKLIHIVCLNVCVSGSISCCDGS